MNMNPSVYKELFFSSSLRHPHTLSPLPFSFPSKMAHIHFHNVRGRDEKNKKRANYELVLPPNPSPLGCSVDFKRQMALHIGINDLFVYSIFVCTQCPNEQSLNRLTTGETWCVPSCCVFTEYQIDICHTRRKTTKGNKMTRNTSPGVIIFRRHPFTHPHFAHSPSLSFPFFFPFVRLFTRSFARSHIKLTH